LAEKIAITQKKVKAHRKKAPMWSMAVASRDRLAGSKKSFANAAERATKSEGKKPQKKKKNPKQSGRKSSWCLSPRRAHTVKGESVRKNIKTKDVGRNTWVGGKFP